MRLENTIDVKSSLKVLHVLPSTNFSGAEKVLLLCCNYAEKVKPIVACSKELASIYNKEGLATFTVDFNRRINTFIKIRNIIINENVDIVHAHDNKASVLCLLLVKLFNLKVKVISHIHNSYPWLKCPSLNRIIDRVTRNHYSMNIYCGYAVKDHYEKYGFYINPKRTVVVQNGIDQGISKNIFNKKDLGIEGKFVYGFIGRLVDQKGLIPFIEELGKKIELFEEAVFLIIGSGEHEEILKSMVNKYSLMDKVKFLGFQSDILPFYDIIDIFFLPSKYEGLPMVVLEAMSYRKCIVSMDVGSVHEVVEHGSTGYLVPSGDYSNFMLQLQVARYKDNSELCRLAAEKIQQSYGINKSIRAIEKVYLSLFN
jgi:glycosyltransferase involved in cell wall biosynthesis